MQPNRAPFDPPAFFDVNASIGHSCRGRAEAPDLPALLARMDSLGIGRSLVWHVAAKETSPTWGNRQLLDEWEHLTEGRRRIVPAFVINPSILWEDRGVYELKARMARHGVRALRLFPSQLNHTLYQVEPLLEELADFKPVLLFDCRSLGPAEALGELAAKFPQVRIVYTHASRPQLPGVFDLLSRHENVWVDTSWLHSCGTLETLAGEFGAHRLIFGIGHPTSNGASVIDLCQAELAPEEKAQIAHRNLEHLLGLDPCEIPPCRTNARGRLWNRLRQGKPVGLEVIDAHGHLGPCGTWMLARQQIEPQIAGILPRMDRLGIRTMIVSGTHALFGNPVAGNRLLEEHAAAHPGRFLGYLCFNPLYHDELTPTFDDLFSREFFVGFKLLNSYWQVPVTDPRCEPVWRYADKHRLPILLHTWDDPYDHPSLLAEIVPRYPGAIFILGHSGGVDGGRGAALKLALENPNVYLEWCGNFQMTLPFEELIAKAGPERILFGSDAALHSPAWELGRFLSLNLDEKLLIPALEANIRRILALRRRPAFRPKAAAGSLRRKRTRS